MSFRKIILTTGDVDGIGLEIAIKSLLHLGPQKKTIFFLFRSEVLAGTKAAAWLKKLDGVFERVVVDDLEQGFDFFQQMSRAKDLTAKVIIDIASDLPPAHWVEAAATACFQGRAAALVTGPLSKGGIQHSGFKDMGHTDILKRVSAAESVHMGFIGDHFNVVLATGHIPLAQVARRLNFKALSDALINANALRLRLPLKQRQKPLAVLGLNPHAGEGGMIGKEELTFFPHLLQFARERKIPMQGPLIPDVAFLKKNWAQFSVFLALYHDQGLGPFKAVHGQDSGVHITLGIPFVRTSVDHGTAKDIFDKNEANPRSMVDAIRWAMQLS